MYTHLIGTGRVDSCQRQWVRLERSELLIAKQLSAQTSLAHARLLRSARGSGSWVPSPSLSASASAMAMERSASADQSPGSLQPGPFLQSHAVRTRQAEAPSEALKPEPQEQVRARIDTIEEQIQQLMVKKLEL